MTPTAAIEFLLWALIAASIIAVISNRLRVPYTVALVLGGLALGSVHLQIVEAFTAGKPDWLGPDVILIIFLPALLFEGSIKVQIRDLRENMVPILLLATGGVLLSTLITGLAVHWLLEIPLLLALVFGAIVAATDPISVLAVFKDMAVSKRLATIIEGESLFNDGTAVVLYTILLAGLEGGHLAVTTGVLDFLVDALGGAAVGLSLGYFFSMVTQKIDDPQIEITLTTILAYGAYLVAHTLHVSGVIATVVAGLMIGNVGARYGMSPRTRISLWSFWEYASFVFNSIIFLLIGLQVRIFDIAHHWQAVVVTIAAVLVGRMLSVYGLLPVGGLFAERIAPSWQHVMVWGGMRGALSLALALGLPNTFPYRSQILLMTLGIVAFTIIVQGLTLKPLVAGLGIATLREDDYARARVRQISLSAALAELEHMFEAHLISQPLHDQLRHDLDTKLEHSKAETRELYAKSDASVAEEARMARKRMLAAEKSSIEEAFHSGLITPMTATQMINQSDREFEELAHDAPSAATAPGGDHDRDTAKEKPQK